MISCFGQSQSAENLSVDSEVSTIGFKMRESKGVTVLPSISKLALLFLLVIIIAFIIAFLLKRFGYGEKKIFNDSSNIKVLSSKKISVKSTIHLVDIDGRQYLIVEKDNAICITSHNSTSNSAFKNYEQSLDEISSSSEKYNKS